MLKVVLMTLLIAAIGLAGILGFGYGMHSEASWVAMFAAGVPILLIVAWDNINKSYLKNLPVKFRSVDVLAGKDNITLEFSLFIISAVIGVYFYVTPYYGMTVDGVHKGPNFELSLDLMLDGDYGALSVSDSFPNDHRCISKVYILRESGVVKYSEASVMDKRNLSRSQLDDCILRIVKYLDDTYIAQDLNYRSYN